MPPHEFILDLACLPAQAAAGGKAAALGRLLAAGFPVPPGFVVTTAAYRACGSRRDLAPPAGGRPDGSAPGQSAGEPEKPIDVGDWPPELAEEIGAAVSALAGPAGDPLAVRSSATLEDQAGASFAGQFETVLHVYGTAAVLQAIRVVWASLGSDRAAPYRRESRSAPLECEMAVLVQRQVAADCAGVLFTADPVSGDPDRLVINAVRGLAEGLVSGRAAPVEYILDRPSQAVLDSPAGREQLLGPGQMATLLEMAGRVERFFGAPQDIEWAFEGERLWIVQSRPITTLAGRDRRTAGPLAGPTVPPAPSAEAEAGLPFPVTWGHPSNRRLLEHEVIFWCNWNTRENMPYPLKPMSWSVLNDLFFPAIAEALWGIDRRSPLYPYNFGLDLIDGRAYFNMNRLRGHPFYGRLFWGMLRNLDREAADVFCELEQSGEFHTQPPAVGWFRLLASRLKALWTFLNLPWLANSRRIQRRFDAYRRLAVAFGRIEPSGRTSQELRAEIRRFTRLTSLRVFPLLLVAGKALACLTLARWMTQGLPGVQTDDLLAGLPGNKTTAAALEMYRLSEMPDSLKPLFEDPAPDRLETELAGTEAGRNFLGRLEAFLDEYGHRGLKDLDIGYPCWREDRSYLYQMIRGYLTLARGDRTPPEQFDQARRRRLAATAAIEAHLSQKFGERAVPARRWCFRKMIRVIAETFPLRENEKHYGLLCYPGIRRILLEIGRRFQETGWLADREDVFFLTLDEVASLDRDPPHDASTLRDQVEHRKHTWEGQVHRRRPFVVRSDGQTVDSGPAGADPAILIGTPASAGRVEGIARIIREPSEAGRFGKGEILVAPYAEPGWAPLFLLAGGVVMEVGGRLCHGAIVAREYGIPAVVGVKEATLRIRDGDTIAVDGSRGEVRLP